ncbi:hypothetical protein PCANC_09948 [Puccinia coronata f. sp. avenae]|uniref:No apical meristem-associated C-terminal domain-containing protein n=1 Tax=Puccinia coronata f. sp. avenae TaxID=200324 RepID=A0A2N5V344_9BASI|nr:hypothetical protein PCANC_09948 [Puccinia coronata f. sp. avenae]
MPPEEITLDPLLESMDPDTSEPPALPEKAPKKKSCVTANDNTDDTPKPKPIKKNNPNWSIEEDKQLCTCNKFGGCYSQVKGQMKSGRSRDNILAEAKELYHTTHNHAFNLDHCWGILKDASKWQAVQAEIESKSTKKAAQDPKKSQDSSSVPNKSEPSSQADNPDEEEEELANKHKHSLLGSDGRPKGQKAAKQKRTDDDLLEKVLKIQEELLRISKDRSNSIKAAMQNASDDCIMAMDLLGMDEESTQYWQKKSNLRLT